METGVPSKETTLAIILGASEFPKQPELVASKAFANSAREFKDYLLNSEGLELPSDNILDLFNNKSAASTLDESIALWLAERKSLLKNRNLTPKDLIIYYVGHGGFSNPGDEYFLALCDTRADAEFPSSYGIRSLASTIKLQAGQMRKYLILDSCFSAAAQAAFQGVGSAPLEAAKRMTLAEFPRSGTALLCAAGPRNPAKTLPDQAYTMFSGALLETLRKGSNNKPETMSLSDVGEITRDLIREQFPDRAVRPEVHAPDQAHGTVDAFPLFPNPAVKEKKLFLIVKRLSDELAGLTSGQLRIEKRQDDLELSLNRLKELVEQQGKVEESPAGIDKPGRGDRDLRYGFTEEQWDTVPPYVKEGIFAWNERRRNSQYWLIATFVICLSAGGFPFTSVNSTILPLLKLPFEISFLLCGSMSLFSIGALLRQSGQRASPPLDSSSWWEGKDIVIKVRKSRWIEALGCIPISLSLFAICATIYTATFASVLVAKAGWLGLLGEREKLNEVGREMISSNDPAEQGYLDDLIVKKITETQRTSTGRAFFPGEKAADFAQAFSFDDLGTNFQTIRRLGGEKRQRLVQALERATK